MKLVIGIVRPEKANDVLVALYRAEVRGVSISRVQGHGGELDRVETYRGTTNTLPSPTSPVRAPAQSASIVASTKSSETATSNRTLSERPT